MLLKEPASAPDFRQRMGGSRGTRGTPESFSPCPPWILGVLRVTGFKQEHLESGKKLQVGMSGDIKEVLVAGHELEPVVYGDRCDEHWVALPEG